MTVGVVVPAAGAGTRLGPGAPKALRLLAGEPLLLHAVRRLRECPSVGPVVVAAPPDQVAEVIALLTGLDATVVAGGAQRQDSVRLGLEALPEEVDLVLVHDAARALVPVSVVEAVVGALRAGASAVVPVLHVADTVKRVAGEVVLETVDRGELRAVQTPQGFTRVVLEKAHASHVQVTDDAAMVEACGVQVLTVPGAAEAFKVTTPFDLLVAEALLVRQQHLGVEGG
ncbi:MAG TPA: 2-C-methyl-D-erythritol 4-phosphate cytidylyltransferase [Mycobacteriales bacterium]|nr:2-C-methyl-D-erythritol 4-phosphate cytidylyltransferase [Mycobacteriales bacterium]